MMLAKCSIPISRPAHYKPKHRCQQVYTIQHCRRPVILMKRSRIATATNRPNRLDRRYPQYYRAQAKHRLALESCRFSSPTPIRHPFVCDISNRRKKVRKSVRYFLKPNMHFETILASLATNPSSSNNGAGSDSGSASLGDASSKSHTDDHNEQYKRMYSIVPIENDSLIGCFFQDYR